MTIINIANIIGGLSVPLRYFQFDIHYSRGFQHSYELSDAGTKLDYLISFLKTNSLEEFLIL